MLVGMAITFTLVATLAAVGGSWAVDANRSDITGQRLYQLIRQRGPIAGQTFEITFLESGAQAFAFTFG